MVMMRIDIDDVKSSNISGITFLAEQDNDSFTNHSSVTGTLLLEYSTGDVYKYFNVPFAVMMSIVGNQSVGSASNKLLKNFRYQKVVVLDDFTKVEPKVQTDQK